MNIQYLFAGFHQGTRVGGLPLAQILLLLGERNPLVSEGDGNADDIYTEDSSQFQLEIIMKNLENRLVAGKQDDEQEEEDEQDPAEGTVEDRNKFGALLPRTGVHFLPDSKVVDFLR